MVANLGMGFEPERYASNTVLTGSDYAAQAAAQQAGYQQQIAGLQRPQDPSVLLGSLISQQAKDNAAFYDNYKGYDGFVDDPKLHSADYWQTYLNQAIPVIATGGTAALTRSASFAPQYVQQYADYAGDAWTGAPGQYQQLQGAYNQQVGAINAQAQTAAAQAKAEADARANNQAAQQQAYTQQTGGGFTGGILNGTYAQPFSSTITGTGFSGGLMGTGSNAAPSTGLAVTGPAATNLGFGGMAPQQSATGWGGPFSAKNPWSLG